MARMDSERVDEDLMAAIDACRECSLEGMCDLHYLKMNELLNALDIERERPEEDDHDDWEPIPEEPVEDDDGN